MFFFIPNMDSSKKKNGKNNGKMSGIWLGVVISLSALFAGSASGILKNPGDRFGGIWEWLINGGFSSDYGRYSQKTGTLLVGLDGQWKFSTGDDLSRANEFHDDSVWDEIGVPAIWENEGYPDYDGYAWYRQYFKLDPSDMASTLFLRLGKIDDVDEVYINGQKIGSSGRFPPNYVSAWNTVRSYSIPTSVVRAGRNTIAVRVYDGQMGGGIGSGTTGIYALAAPELLIDLQGEWQFATGENPGWKGEIVEETSARKLVVPLGWDFQGYEDYDGIAWYRRTFAGPEIAEEETMVLLLGKIDDTDEAFLNGQWIGNTGKLNSKVRRMNSPYFRMTRQYEFSSALLKKSNTLAVRVYDVTGYGGIYSGPVGIVTKSAFLVHQQQLAEAEERHFADFMDWLLGRQ